MTLIGVLLTKVLLHSQELDFIRHKMHSHLALGRCWFRTMGVCDSVCLAGCAPALMWTSGVGGQLLNHAVMIVEGSVVDDCHHALVQPEDGPLFLGWLNPMNKVKITNLKVGWTVFPFVHVNLSVLMLSRRVKPGSTWCHHFTCQWACCWVR